MSYAAAELLRIIRKHRLRFFTTADLVTLTGMHPSAATQALRRLAARDLTGRLKRGLWMNRLQEDLHPYEAVPHLTAPWPAYVSLYSALADYGLVEEIPQVTYAVSSNKPRRYLTPMGSFHIHHLPERLIWGYEMRKTGRGSYPMAEPEKAFLDLVYLALIPRSGLRFPHKRQRRWNLDAAKLRRAAARFDFPPLVSHLKRLGF